MRTFSFCLLFILFFSITHAQDLNRQVVKGVSSDKHTEFAPTLSADGRTMIFQSDAGSGWELYESKLQDDGNWSEPFPLKEINDKCDFVAGPSLSYDGNILYFTAFIEGETESEDIYFATRIDETTWGEPKSIGEPINTNDDYEGFPSVSSDGNSLYFIRLNHDYPYDRKNKENCFRIYVSHKETDGSWGQPVALPDHINNACERDPKIMADNHTLIFSSIREGGKGKFDLYQSRLQADGSWGEVIALDYINSPDSDQSPGISASGDKVYYYSSKDIFVSEIPTSFRQMINITIQGKVIDVGSGDAVSATIEVRDNDSGALISTLESNPNDGKYSLVLQGGTNYKAIFSSPQHFTHTILHELKEVESYKEVKSDIALKSSYVLNISLKDKDIDKGLSGYFTINTTDKIFYQDSLLLVDQPLRLEFKTTENYQLSVQVKDYPVWEERLIFDPNTTLATADYAIEVPFEKIKFKAKVTDVVSRQKMKVKVYFKNEDEDEVLIADADETVFLRKGDRYEVLTSSDKGYVFASSKITAGEGTPDAYGNYSVDLEVMRVTKGMNLGLNMIVFELNSAELDSVSFFELDRVIEMLSKNDDIKIEIAAHTDDLGDSNYNLKLSEKRAASVVEYLKSKNVEADRMIAKGYGMEKPLVPNTSDENRAKNRRVELVVLSTGNEVLDDQ